MARLIDADALSEQLNERLRCCNKGSVVEACFLVSLDMINSMPAVSLTPNDPVHAAGACYCWECKHWKEHYDYCKEFAAERNQGDFCSYGQRREGSQ